MACKNPCENVVNTAECESQASQLANFIRTFYGTITKYEEDGQVKWALPCNLETGLLENPRQENEGLACYFLRLFEDGIKGLKGDKGDKGDPGADGHHAYTVNLASFTPVLNETSAVYCYVVASLLPQSYVFIENSGWYQVQAINPEAGIAWLRYERKISNPVETVPAGSLIVPVGCPGTNGLDGEQGPPGPAGPQGPPGENWPAESTAVAFTSGGEFAVSTTYTTVAFGGNEVKLTLSGRAIYLIQATAGWCTLTNCVATDLLELQLYNITTSEQLPGAYARLAGWAGADKEGQLTVMSRYELLGSGTTTVALQARASNASRYKLYAVPTTLIMVKLHEL